MLYLSKIEGTEHMNTDRLAYFLAVVREGSFSAAARSMYVSQTAISQQIAALEKELNCGLFYRKATGTVLTESGVQFLPYAEQMMHLELEMKDTFVDVSKPDIVRIAYNGPLEKEMIISIYLALHKQRPSLVIQPVYMSLAAMPDALYRGQCDVIITLQGEIIHGDVYQEIIEDLPMVAAVSQASELAEYKLLTLERLHKYPLILLAPDQSKNVNESIHAWAKKLGFADHSIVYADSADLQVLMVALNLGISFLPQKEVSYLKGVKLIPVDADLGRHRAVLAARRLTPTIRAMRDSILARI